MWWMLLLTMVNSSVIPSSWWLLHACWCRLRKASHLFRTKLSTRTVIKRIDLNVSKPFFRILYVLTAWKALVNRLTLLETANNNAGFQWKVFSLGRTNKIQISCDMKVNRLTTEVPTTSTETTTELITTTMASSMDSTTTEEIFTTASYSPLDAYNYDTLHFQGLSGGAQWTLKNHQSKYSSLKTRIFSPLFST